MTNIINEPLLENFKKGRVSVKGVQIRTRFRVNVQNVLDSINALLDKEAKQLTNREIDTLIDMRRKLVTIQGE